MKRMKFTGMIALSLMLILGCLTPVFAVGNYDNNDTESEETDSGFGTLWFENHRYEDEYTISTASQLQGLADLVNEGRYDGIQSNQYEDFKGKTIKLSRDITIRNGFTPIGRSNDICFKGVFDGDGHTITVNINENGGYAGLFGYLGGTVENLTVKGTVKSSGAECGAFAGYLSRKGIVKNCQSEAKVTGKAKTGGIVGHNDGGRVDSCINIGDVKGTMKVGGVVGENWGVVVQCGNRGEVQSTQRGATTYGTGGVCGRSVSYDSVIDKCFNTGKIVSGTEGTGGICGYMNAKGAKISNCYNTGHMTVNNNSVLSRDGIRGYAGGIVGIAGMKGLEVRNCYNTGPINNSDVSGGIIGEYLDESKFLEDPYIANNYYLNVSGVRGIGSDNVGKSKNIREGTEKITPATLISGASNLGNAYMEDSQSYYGADGFPVLKWQKKYGKMKNARLACITGEMQNQFDRFLAQNTIQKRAEWPVIMFFNHSAFSSQALGGFHDEKVKQIIDR